MCEGAAGACCAHCIKGPPPSPPSPPAPPPPRSAQVAGGPSAVVAARLPARLGRARPVGGPHRGRGPAGVRAAGDAAAVALGRRGGARRGGGGWEAGRRRRRRSHGRRARGRRGRGPAAGARDVRPACARLVQHSAPCNPGHGYPWGVHRLACVWDKRPELGSAGRGGELGSAGRGGEGSRLAVSSGHSATASAHRDTAGAQTG